MAGGYRVDPATFDAAGAAVDAVAGQVAAAASALLAGLSGTGGMAGDDRVGHAFSADYDPAAQGLCELAQKLGPGLESVAAALRMTGANYRGADSASVMRSGG